jgi:tRNA threonylcarbamoyl adenosine modification protein YeaZ
LRDRKRLILGLESAIAGGSISLVSDGREVASHVGVGNFVKAESFVKLIDQILSENDISLGDVTEIVVSRGPGSYTGIRVALSTVLGLVAATRIAVLGITVLEALSELAEGRRLVSVPIGRGMICCQSFEGKISTKPFVLSELGYHQEVIKSPGRTIIAHENAIFSPASSGIKIINAGMNMAAFLCNSVGSNFATDMISPLFV